MGKIEGLSANELRTFLKGGQSNIAVTLSKPSSTGISQVGNDITHDAPAYKLNGQLAKTYEQGVIIKNGRKIIRK